MAEIVYTSDQQAIFDAFMDLLVGVPLSSIKDMYEKARARQRELSKTSRERFLKQIEKDEFVVNSIKIHAMEKFMEGVVK